MESFVIQEIFVIHVQYISEGLTICLGFVTDRMYFPVTE